MARPVSNDAMNHPKHILEALGANAQKRFSQNFLLSEAWIERLTAPLLADSVSDEIWEVGPGLGALSERLIALSKKPVHLFEIDRKLAQHLRTRFPSVPLTEGDFLDLNVKELSEGKKIGILSNLPYHISSQIFFLLLPHRERWTQLVLTFQKEFADRVLAKPRTPDYGALSVLAQLCFETRSLGELPPGVFYPQPGVASQALSFTPLPPLAVTYDQLALVVKTAFLHRRKKAFNNLRGQFGDKMRPEHFESLGIGPLARPEEISPTTYAELTSRLS
jgi:16S rRNA (adenine1518-N6/adenine1519-N6)-dimethyltransferase